MITKTGTPKKPRSRRKPARIWHLVTNHQNMLYMLATGMVMGPAGFRGKHYSDPLSVYPGWITLFRDKVNIPAEALQQAIAERKHLAPCIASYHLEEISGNFQMLPSIGKTRVVTSLPKTKGKNEVAALLRAPLPLNLLSCIHFRTVDEMEAFKSAAGDVSNVDLSLFDIKVDESLFSIDDDMTWPPKGVAIEMSEGDHPPAFGLALGGVIAMLYHTASRSEMGLAIFRLATGAASERDNEVGKGDPILAELPNWMNGRGISEQADTRAKLFWGVVQSLVSAQTQERPPPPIDVALAYLEGQLDLLPEIKFRPLLERLIADMKGFLGLGGGTVTELFERHKGSLSRPLLLFCLREHCMDLLEFSHPLLSDAEYLVAGILFGVRDSWLQLPKELRYPDLSVYVSFRMADAEHNLQGHGLSMDPPPRPIPLREPFTLPNGEWNSNTKDVVVEFASKCNWNDCIQTHITLAEGDLPDSFERKDLQVVLPGRISAVVEEVDEAKFLRRLGQWPPIDPQVESELREKLVLAKEKYQTDDGNK